ncbi:DUF1343 domain-containing protein [Polycladomyces sp. WAk]|uniref:DUF1343 domain-containing protein n=1 Tax=Polycladomyces zharkentensis TaxID=2807616 RepID=A0ABS2WMI2_9BACL|nr:DUF1343 domain-containing protein [Polycladomyces sp. WAk]MBN2910656.1 DUF1343 domain-containing protein [Polycladomyces sp. WAk]
MHVKRWLSMAMIGLLSLGMMGSEVADGAESLTSHHRGHVKTGLEILLEHPESLAGKRVGLITNPTGMTRDYQHGLDAMLAKGIRVVKVYGPEHGVRGTEQAGQTPGSFVDPRTGLPFVNLYGKTPDEMVPLFDGVDVLVFDIQDVGTRFYTYIYTMAYAMEAAAKADIPFIVLDRPNPIGGEKVEGPVLAPAYRSFVGLFPIPLRHGMTVGELAQLFNGEFLPEETGGKRARLTVIRMKGWTRNQWYDQTGLPWVPPSPNMPTLDTATVYPGMGLIEGTNLSEGRGTTRPFELIGAPYIEGWKLADALNRANLPGVSFREAYFTPTFSKYTGKTVGGVQVYVEDPRTFDPVLTGLTLIQTVKQLYPDQFAWRETQEPYWIDKLTGTDQVRKQIDAGVPAREIAAQWKKGLESFRQMRSKYLLYPPHDPNID